MNSLFKKIVRPLFFDLKQIYYYISGKPRARGFIFMLHRVSEWEDGKIFWNENMKVNPSKLDEIILDIKKKFDIIRLEDVPARLLLKNKKKFVVFTFDDGYKDNLTDALPVFKKHNAPFTIFITSDFMDRKAILWWYSIEDLILCNNRITLSNGKTFLCNTMEDKKRSFLEIREEILKIDQKDLEKGLNALFANYTIDWYSNCEKLCLSWEEVRQLTNEPLVTLGAHTQHHYNLLMLASSDDVRKEILAGNHRVKEEIGIDLSVFAYPYGLAKEREFEILSDLGDTFQLAVIIGNDAVTDKNNRQYCLPRIMMEYDYNSLSIKRLPNCCII